MMILGYAAVAGLALIWVMSQSPLGRAIGTSVNQFVDASHRDENGLG